MFRRRAERSHARPAIYEKRGGRWTPLSWGDFYLAARKVAHGLRETLSLAAGERVATLGATRAAWGTYDLGAQLAGMISFGIYPELRPTLPYMSTSHNE